MSLRLSRRHLLRLIASGVVGHTLDIDRLLWVPGKKTIFIPPARYKWITESQIVAIELERILPRIREMFQRDDLFYQHIACKQSEVISNRNMRIPLEIKNGIID